MEKPFGHLATSQADSIPELCDLQAQVDSLYRHSFSEEDETLDYPITIEELDGIVSRLRSNKAPGMDEVTPELLKFGGEALKAWLC